MGMVRFATLCDVEVKRVGIVSHLCHRRSEEYTAWPSCRACGEHVCDQHEPKGTRYEDDSDDADGVAQMRVSVMCPACLKEYGPDDDCVVPDATA